MMKRELIFVALLLAALPARAQRTASNPLGAQLNVQDAGTCSTTNSFAWQVLPANASTTIVNLSGTFSGTLTIRLSTNGGGSWTTNSTTTTAGNTSVATNGFTDICADITTFTSGIFQVSISTGLNTGPQGPAGPSGSPAGQNSLTLYVGPTCPVSNANQCFFANFDVKTCFDGAVSSGSPTVTTAGQCSFAQADVGKKIFVTNMCSAGQCGFTLYEASITILPTQTTDTTIASVQSATSLTAAANASGTLASGATVAYGHDDTANLNAAYAALIALPGCGTLVMPGNAMAFFSNRIFVASSPVGGCFSSDNIHSLSQVDLNAMSITIEGQGRNSTVLIPTPGFAGFASCSPACIGGGVQGVNWRHFAISGLGQSFLGAAVNCATPFLVSGGNGGGGLLDMGFSGWCTGSQGAVAGVQIPQFTQVEYVTCTAFGAFCGGTSATNVQISNSVWFSGRNGSFLSTGTVQSSNNEYYGPAQGNIGMDLSGTFTSSNDILLPVNGAPSGGASDVVVRNGAVFNAVNFTNSGGIAGSFALNVVAGGTARLSGFRVTAARTTAVTNAGTIVDLGGNIYNGPTTNTGTIIGVTNSALGTACATGNFALTSGWGTSSVASVAASGTIQGCHVTITGAAGAAGPVLTWTYPAAPPIAPGSCHIVGVSGTLTGVAVGTPGATSVAFTFAGTPSAQTYVFDLGCP